MSRNFCLMPDDIAKLAPKMKELGGAKLISMEFNDLADFFGTTLGSEKTGTVMAKSFKQAVLSQRKDAINKWLASTLTVKEMATYKERQKAEALKKLDTEYKERIEYHTDLERDTIEKALGIDITEEETAKIVELAQKIKDMKQKAPDNPYLGVHTDYVRAMGEMKTYIDTINPLSIGDLLFGTIGRGNLLTSIKSPVTNIVSNAATAMTELIQRRISERKASGLNNDLIMPYVKLATDLFRETGIDIVRTMQIGNERTVLGETFRQIGNQPGAIPALGRLYQQYIFRGSMGLPDVVFASGHFADKVNLMTTKLADKKLQSGEIKDVKEEARRLFLESTKLTNEEVDGEMTEPMIIRDAGVQDALYATYQQESWYSKFLLKFRNTIDELSGFLKLGTNLDPFVKTPANVIGAGLTYSGVSVPFDVIQMMANAWNGNPIVTREISTRLTRAGLGTLVAMLLASALDDDDYMPDYMIATPHQRELQKLSNAAYNSIRIGDKWVSLAYFGVIGVTLAGFLNMRSAQNKDRKLFSYAEGALMQMRQLPVISQLFDMYEYASEAKKYQKTAEDITNEGIQNFAGFAWARVYPSIFNDAGKAIDDKERFTDWNDWTAKIQNQIPFARELLPPKYNGLGQTVPTENAFWTIVAGARVKSAPSDTEVFSELVKLSGEGEDVTLSVKNLKNMKSAKVLLSGREYNELTGAVQEAISTTYANIMTTPEYKEEDSEGKKKMLMDARKGVMEAILDERGYLGRIEEYEEALKEAKED